MDDEKADEMLTVMRDVRALLRMNLREEINQTLRDAFGDNDAQKEAFKLLGEGKSYREIAEEVDTSHTTVGRWVGRWRDLGLVAPEDDDGEYLISPEALGL